MMNNIIEACTRLGNNFDSTTENDFWFLWEVLNNEAETGLYTAFHISTEQLAKDILAGSEAGNATYAIGLVYALFVFVVIFGNVRSRLRQETKYSRNGNVICTIIFLIF